MEGLTHEPFRTDEWRALVVARVCDVEPGRRYGRRRRRWCVVVIGVRLGTRMVVLPKKSNAAGRVAKHGMQRHR